MPKERKTREGSRNAFVRPEVRSPLETLASRIYRTVAPYLKESMTDEENDKLFMEVKADGKQFYREVKDGIIV